VFLLLGCVASFFLVYHEPRYLFARMRSDAFWDDVLVFFSHRYTAPILWLLPYLTLMLIRSIWWSIKTLRTKQPS